MADELNNNQNNGGGEDHKTAGELKEARDDAARYRRQLREKETELENLRKAQETAAQEKLAEEKKFELLAEERRKRIEELEPVKTKADAYEAALKATNEQRIQAIAEKYRSLVPTFTDPVEVSKWLDTNAGKLEIPKAPDLNAGASGNAGAVTLTAEEQKAAQKLGVTAEEFAKHKNSVTRS